MSIAKFETPSCLLWYKKNESIWNTPNKYPPWWVELTQIVILGGEFIDDYETFYHGMDNATMEYDAILVHFQAPIKSKTNTMGVYAEKWCYAHWHYQYHHYPKNYYPQTERQIYLLGSDIAKLQRFLLAKFAPEATFILWEGIPASSEEKSIRREIMRNKDIDKKRIKILHYA